MKQSSQQKLSEDKPSKPKTKSRRKMRSQTIREQILKSLERLEKRNWLVGILIFIIIIVIAVTNWFFGAAQGMSSIYDLCDRWQINSCASTPTPTVTPIPTATLIASTATSDEILILLADFQDESENVHYDVAGRIEETLRTALTQYDLLDVCLVRINQTFKRGEVEAIKTLGKRYNATLFIWGYYDDAGMYPRFTVLQEQRLQVLPEGPIDKLVNLARPPEDFILYINRDLPTQMTYFTQFTLGQILFLKASYPEALVLFEDALKSVETTETEEIQSSLNNIYLYKGVIYIINRNFRKAIFDYTKVIDLGLNPPTGYNNRGSAYYLSGDYEQAIHDFNKAIELSPNFAMAYINRGSVYLTSGNLKQVIRDFNKAVPRK